MKGTTRWTTMLALVFLVAAGGCASPRGATQTGAQAAAAAPVRVKTGHPSVGPASTAGVEQPADVAAYYSASLFAEIAGTVTFLEKAPGDAVRAGEKLVALRPLDAAQVGSQKTILRAPFDGVVATRAVDPGTFVPSASIVPGAPALLSIMRTDIVTLSMRVPDTFVAWVTLDTPVEIRVDAFPGRTLRCTLSRIAPNLSTADRTMGVEVDLYNGTSAEYARFLDRERRAGNADLKSRKLPVFPEGLKDGEASRLRPGMYGRMKLVLASPRHAALIPSSAVVRVGGMPYVYRVENGVARRASVTVEADDGTLARVFWRTSVDGKDAATEMTERDEIVLTNQGELEDGSAVLTSSETAAP